MAKLGDTFINGVLTFSEGTKSYSVSKTASSLTNIVNVPVPACKNVYVYLYNSSGLRAATSDSAIHFTSSSSSTNTLWFNKKKFSVTYTCYNGLFSIESYYGSYPSFSSCTLSGEADAARANNRSIVLGNSQAVNNDNSVTGVAIGNGCIVGKGTVINVSNQPNYKDYIAIGIDGHLVDYITSSSSGWASSSDYRDKSDIEDIPSDKSLNFITSLQGKTYVYNKRDWYKDESGNFDEESYLKGTKKKTRRTSGFIAQDVYQNMIDIFGSDNYAAIVDKENYNGYGEDAYFMCNEALIPFLVEAVKEQQKTIDSQTKQIKELKNTIENN